MNRIPFLDFSIDNLNWEQTLERIDHIICKRVPVQHCVLNASKVLLAKKNRKLLKIIQGCEMVQADGISIVWAGRLLEGKKIPRIPGVDLMKGLLTLAQEKKYSVFFLGATSDVLRSMLLKFQNEFPYLRIAGFRDGYFTPHQNNEVVSLIQSTRPDILFVGISSPQKEYWLAENLSQLGVPFCMGVGGSFDIYSGLVKRAPVLMQRMGLEWLFRWVQEPRRLFKRYFWGNLVFSSIIFREFLDKKTRTIFEKQRS